MTRFVVLATARSGSTWVADMLHSHPAIVAVRAELLLDKPKRPYWRVAKEPCGGAKYLMRWTPYWKVAPRYLRLCKPYVLFRYLDAFYTPRTGIRAIGFKLLYEQARVHPEILGYFVFKRVAVLHLIRRNLLDSVISYEAVVARGGIYHARVGATVQPVTIRLDPSTVVQRLTLQEHRVRNVRRILSLLGLRCLEVFYEDLVSGATPFARLVNFLGIESGQHPLTSSLQKLNQAPHQEIIENYAGVRHALEGTRFRPFLQGP